MWYTTSFDWQFKLSKELTVSQYSHIEDNFYNRDPTRDWLHIEHNWGEKDYVYKEELNNLIEYLSSIGIELTWQVKYQWEEVGDMWIIEVEDGKVNIIEATFNSDKVCCPHCEEEFYVEQSL